MVFIIIIVLSLIATYLLISSGIFKDLKWFKKPEDEEIEAYEIDELVPGMMGSAPSDSIDVYDSRKLVTIPIDGAIAGLVSSFRANANQVYSDFKDNKNSDKYKAYVFDDYKLEILRRNDSLSDEDMTAYFNIRNTIVKDINDLFTYHLDKIKYSEDKSYFTLRREILNREGTGLILTEQNMDIIANYAIANTKIPGGIVLLLKHKLSVAAQEMLDQLVMLAGFNYNTVLEVLEQVLVREPLPGLSILGIVNTPLSSTVDGVITVRQGFWTQIYFAFKTNNIDNFLVALIRLSFMTEQTYRAVLAAVVANLRNPKLTDAMNSIVRMCRESRSKIIKTFPYNFTHSLLIDAIKENRIMIKSNRLINVAQVDRESDGISNIEKYSNIEANFPVSIQELKPGSPSSTNEYDLVNPIYPILSDEYMVNDYLSFPNIKHRGVYLDRTKAGTATAGYIVITNTATTLSLTIGGLIVYGVLQSGYINDDYKTIDNSIVDSNIINNSGLVVVESGDYASRAFTNASDDINIKWLTGDKITIPANKSIRIRANTSTITGTQYLRILAMVIPFVTKPISNFLKISTVYDKAAAADNAVYNEFVFKNIPKSMPNILCTFDSTYAIAASTGSTDTFVISANNFASELILAQVGATSTNAGASAGVLNTENIFSTNRVDTTSGANDGLFTGTTLKATLPATLPTYKSVGLISNTTLFHSTNPNLLREGYRIRIKNTGPAGSELRIKKFIVYGNVNSTNSFPELTGLSNIISDDNILYKGTQVTAIKMNATENSIISSNNDLIVDQNQQQVVYQHTLGSNESIYIDPTTSSISSLASKYISIRAIYVEFDKVAVPVFNLSIIKLNPATTAANNLNTIANVNLSSASWNKNAFLLFTNNIAQGGSIYTPGSNFSILPDYTRDNFSTLPNYMEDRFQADYYDQYYNPVSELVQYPSNFE